MKVIHTIEDLQAGLSVLKAQGKKVGLVPGVAPLRSKVIIDAADAFFEVAATACHLGGKALRSKAAFVALRDHASVNTGKTLRKCVLNASKTSVDGVV